MVSELTLENYDDVLKSKNVIVIDFWAGFCNPCKTFKKVFESLSQKEEYKDKVDFYTCDAEEQDDLSAKFSIRGLPTLVFIKQGTVCGRTSGAISEEEAMEKINNCLSFVVE